MRCTSRCVERDRVDLALDELDPSMKLAMPGPGEVVDVREPERDEEQPGLIHVQVVAVDDLDLHGFGIELSA